MAAGRLRLALALILGLASATKRLRRDDSSDSNDSRQDQSSRSVFSIPVLRPAPSETAPVTEGTGSYLLRRVVQTVGCLFGDTVACSGGFDSPMGHAVILLSHVFAKAHPGYEPVKSIRADMSLVWQLRSELTRQVEIQDDQSSARIVQAGTEELRVIAAEKLIRLSMWGSEEDLNEALYSAIVTWDKIEASDEQIKLAVTEVFTAADRTAALFDQSAFVWPSGQSGNDPLHPEEKLYAAAVVIMCRRLGVRPVSVFLFTRKFGNCLPLGHRNFVINWRRPTFQVIAKAAGETVSELDPGELCEDFIKRLGITENLNAVPHVGRHRFKKAGMREPHEVSAEPPLPPAPLVVPLPTALRDDFKEVDRLLLVRSLQVVYLTRNQKAVDQRSLGNLFSQASIVITLLLKLNDHGVPSDLAANKPEPDFGPLDLLRVIAEADRRPDLSAVATVGDVMIAAAQMIFRHLYLTLPVTAFIDAEKFNVVKLPEAHLRNMGTLALYLRSQGAPHTLSDSPVLTGLYEATDAMLWAAFRIASWQRVNMEKTFVICTHQMSEKIPIARQYTRYFLPRILWGMLGENVKTAEAAALDLLVRILSGPEGSGDPQTLVVPRAPNAMHQIPGAVSRAPSVMQQVPSVTPQASGAAPWALGIMQQVPSVTFQASGAEPRAPNVTSQASGAEPRAPSVMPQVPSATSRAPSDMYQAPGVTHQVPVMEPQVPVITPQAATISDQVVMSDQAASSTDQMVFKVMTLMEIMFPNCGMSIRHIREISAVILPHLHTNLTRAWELASSNRLMMTLQLQKLDDKLKRDRIPFSDADHVTVLLDALVALHLLQQGAVFQLASIPRTRMSDIDTEDKGNLTLLLVEALFKATSMQTAERSTSAAFSELTKMLTSAVEATASN